MNFKNPRKRAPGSNVSGNFCILGHPREHILEIKVSILGCPRMQKLPETLLPGARLRGFLKFVTDLALSF